MEDLKNLRIDRDKRRQEPSRWAKRWIVGGIAVFVLLGTARLAYMAKMASAPEVETARVMASGPAVGGSVVLNATGYIVAHHKIEVASKVNGRVAWIGVEKGDKVKEGQTIVRLDDTEYRAQLAQARGNLANLRARLLELKHGSRPQEIEAAKANLDQAQADLADAKVSLNRTRELSNQGIVAKQVFDDAQSRYDAAAAKVVSLDKTYDLARIGPRQEQIEAMQGQVEQAQGVVAFAEDQLSNTMIRAPVAGTVLDRNVEKGEFLTTGFVGEKGAKGYVVSLADLNDLQVELDIAQNDFAKLHMSQKGLVTTDAYPDRKYSGYISEISPEADRQKATVQVKVKIVKPDDYLRPDMNANVAFLSDEKPTAADPKPRIVVPSSAVHNDSVFVVLGGKALQRSVKTGPATSQGVQVTEGLVGGEDLVVNPPSGLRDGDRVRLKPA
jgi:HlyD family secretion protein